MNEKALKRDKHKSKRTILPGILAAAGTLLYCRNQRMNSHQTLTGLQLKNGGVTKQAIKRLNDRFLCISYKSILRQQTSIGKDFDAPVKMWSKQMEEDKQVEEDMKSRIQQMKTLKAEEDMNEEEMKLVQEAETSLGKHRMDMHPGFKIVLDNVDLRISPRQMSRKQGHKDLHYCNVMAVKNRVSQYHRELICMVAL